MTHRNHWIQSSTSLRKKVGITILFDTHFWQFLLRSIQTDLTSADNLTDSLSHFFSVCRGLSNEASFRRNNMTEVIDMAYRLNYYFFTLKTVIL